MRHKQITTKTDFYYHFFRNILIVALPLLVISAIVLSSLHISATGSGSSTDTLSFSISSSCTLRSVVDRNHNAELINGTYVDGIGQTTITTLCNDGNGYSIYANGYSNNEEGNNKLVNTENSNFNIISGTAESGATSNWAMSLNNLVNDPSLTPPTIENAYNNTYDIVPNEWTKVASLPARATDMIKGSSFTTTYAVYTSSSQYTGTYNGQVKYMLVHPSNKPVVYFMQDVASWKNTLGLEENVQAIDKRDGKSYWVTKLKDGHIWMTQNLDFDIEANTTLNSNTTDLNVAYDSGQYAEYNDGYTESNGIIYYTPASTAATIDFTGTAVSGWQSSNTAPASASKTDSTETGHNSLGNYYNWTAAIASNNSSSLTQDTLSDISKNPQNSICPKGWRLPTVSSQSGSDTGSTNEFARLNYIYNGNSSITDSSLIASPLYFVKSGNVYVGNLGQFSVRGSYWSSTLGGLDAGQNKSYFLEFESSKVQTTGSYNRVNGRSVRCVAR